jgi:L-lysine 2,3-aminomutase
MRIFVKPSEESASITNLAQEALDALRSAGIASARIGGFINNQGVVLVDVADHAFALTMLARAGFTAVADSA